MMEEYRCDDGRASLYIIPDTNPSRWTEPLFFSAHRSIEVCFAARADPAAAARHPAAALPAAAATAATPLPAGTPAQGALDPSPRSPHWTQRKSSAASAKLQDTPAVCCQNFGWVFRRCARTAQALQTAHANVQRFAEWTAF